MDEMEFAVGVAVRISANGKTCVGIVEETKEDDFACGMVMCRAIPFYDEMPPAEWRQRGLVKTKYLKTLLLPGQMLTEES